MRWLIDYIRSCFCKHEWELLQEAKVYDDVDCRDRRTEPYIIGSKWLYRCKKCGCDKLYKNY